MQQDGKQAMAAFNERAGIYKCSRCKVAYDVAVYGRKRNGARVKTCPRCLDVSKAWRRAQKCRHGINRKKEWCYACDGRQCPHDGGAFLDCAICMTPAEVAAYDAYLMEGYVESLAEEREERARERREASDDEYEPEYMREPGPESVYEPMYGPEPEPEDDVVLNLVMAHLPRDLAKIVQSCSSEMSVAAQMAALAMARAYDD